MKKRVFSALLALVLTLSAVVLPASAAGSFSDVSDKKTAQNVEVLRLLGVVEGNGIGQFNPYAQLTRAEFCKMLVTLMGSSDVLRYKTVTIFPDGPPAMSTMPCAVKSCWQACRTAPSSRIAPSATVRL